MSATVLSAGFLFSTMPAFSADVLNMQELLERVKQGSISENSENRKREANFSKMKSDQERLLNEAIKTRQAEEARSTELERKFEDNDKKLTVASDRLRETMGSLTELFGHITTASGDLRSTLQNSLTNSQFPDRIQFLDDLIAKTSNTSTLPNIEEIEGLWYELQREMIESGKIVKYNAHYNRANGEKAQEDVVRVGVFNVVSSEGNYLTYNEQGLSELARQPSSKYTGMAEALVQAKAGLTKFGVDPTGPAGGSYLAALIETPDLVERWHQGGIVGYIITGVGAVALLVALWRLLVLSLMSTKVRSQLKNAGQPKANNPLGRVLKVHRDNPSVDVETLELKLSEAVLKELPALEYGQTLLKIIAGVAPLLGLLGTVTGMIITFQAIVIYGAGDPKAMAGGISSALITTVLGLCVAIPTVLLHTAVSGRSRRIIHVLEEQAAGIIAKQNEVLAGKEG
jgi:biopolymer transport protein ExbB